MIRIAVMRPADVQESRALWKRTRGVGLNESDTPARIRAYLKRNPRMSFVARERERLVGAVLCGHEGRRGYLHHLAVAPSHRRRGTGRTLVRRCLEALRKRRIQKCNAFLFAGNRSGLRFWKRVGFRSRDDLRTIQFSLGRPAKRSC